MFENKVLLATRGHGLARAERDAKGNWSVASLLADEPVRCLASVPGNPNTVYAGTHGHGVLHSEDRGLTWQPAGMAGQIVRALAASPHEPGVLYAGTKPAGVFITRDGGANWTDLEAFRHIRGYRFWRSPAEPPDWRAYVSNIAISPIDPKVLVAGIEFGAVVRSEDGGRTWSNHKKGAIRDCHTLMFHRSNGDWVYEAGASLAGAALSRDGGVSWLQPKQGLKHHYGWACAADPERPEVWYLSAGPYGWGFEPQAHQDGRANAAIYRSAGGAAWERLDGGLPQPMTHLAYALVTDPAAPGHLYAGLSSGEVWHTADYGDSWEKLPFNLGPFHGRMILA
ncbi:MAG: hypothetical protein PVI09_19495 [Anaerolineae bacterium]|jgi:hypothetical protein